MLEPRSDLLTVQVAQFRTNTVAIIAVLGSDAVMAVVMEQSDYEMELALKGEWKSAITMCGGRCVMTCGAILMLGLSASIWDCQAQMPLHCDDLKLQ